MTASSELPRRRFIAGAVCPKCQALDRMVLEVDVDDNEQTRHCVACGFSETLQAKSTRNAPMPRARFERTKAQAVDVEPSKFLIHLRLPTNPKTNFGR